MKVNKASWKQLAYICVFIALISNTGSLGNKPCNWTQYQGDEAHTAHCETDIVPPLAILWKRTIEHVGISGSPVVSGDHLVLLLTLGTPTYDCYLICYRIDKTGLQLVWRQFLSHVYLGVTPAIAGNTVICPSYNRLYCFDLETGHQLPEISLESTPTTPTTIEGADLAAMAGYGTRDGPGYLFLVDISSGEVVWTKTNIGDSPGYFYNIVTAGDDKLFVYYSISGEEGLAAFNLQGELLWKRPGYLATKWVDDRAVITLYTGGILFAVGSPNTTLFALDGESGDVLWSHEGNHLLDVLSSDGTHLYVYSKIDEAVLCLDVRTGEEIWKSPPLFPGDKELPMFFDKSLVSTRNHVFICRHAVENVGIANILALDSSTGEVVWSSEEIENLRGPLIICHDILVARISEGLIGFGELHDTGPPLPEPTLPAQPEPSFSVSTFALLIIAGIFGGILITYLLIRKRKP